MISQAYVDIFFRLNSSRQTGFGLSSIPVSEITDYYYRVNDMGDDIEEFITCIQAMDNKFLEIKSKQKQQEQNSRPTTQGSKSPRKR